MVVGDADVDAQHLPEELGGVLGPVVRVVARAAIAEPDIEVSVGPECEMAAVVVRERLFDDRAVR
jgi:hypothetical protein